MSDLVDDPLPPVTPEDLKTEVENNTQRLKDIEERVLRGLSEKIDDYCRRVRCGRRIDGVVIALLVAAAGAVLATWARGR
jgi:tetrahydromethanopterin S-methyltransferase subunit G